MMSDFAGLAAEAGLDFHPIPNEADPQRLARHPVIQAAARRGGQLRVLMTMIRVARPTLATLFAAIGAASATAEALIASSIPPND